MVKNIVFLSLVSVFTVRATLNIAFDMVGLYIVGLTIFCVPVCGFLVGKVNGFLETTCLALTIACIFYFDTNFPFDREYNWIPMIGMMIMLFISLLLGFGVKVTGLIDNHNEFYNDGYTDKYHCDPIKTNAAPNATSDYGVNGMLNTYNNKGL